MNTSGSHYKKNVNVKIAVLHIECSAFLTEVLSYFSRLNNMTDHVVHNIVDHVFGALKCAILFK